MQLQAGLQNCKQVYFDPNTRTLVHCTVTQFFEAFLTVVETFDPTKPYPGDIATTFFNNLALDLQESITTSTSVTLPTAPDWDTNSAQLQQITEIKAIAEDFEQKEALVDKKINQMTRGHGSYNIKTMVATVQPGFVDHPNATESISINEPAIQEAMLANQGSNPWEHTSATTSSGLHALI